MILPRLVTRLSVSFFLAGIASTSFAADVKPILSVYTYDAFQSKWGPGPKLKASFEATCKCELKFIPAADGAALLSRLKVEGKQTKADIALGLDSTATKEAKATDLFEHLPASTNWALPLTIEDLDLFQPVDYSWYAFMYDTNAFQPQAKNKRTLPQSLEALIKEPSLRRQVIIQDPRSSSVGLGLMLWMHARFGEKYQEALKALHAQTMLVGHGWSDSYSKFTKGEAPMVLSYMTSEAYHREEEKTDRYRALKFSDGNYLQVEVAGMLKSSKQKDLAKKFLDFIATPKAQVVIAKGNWMYPVIALKDGLPHAYEVIAKPDKTLYLPASVVFENRKKWTEEWAREFSSK